nr:unnamed protein product [Callosobruchus analis]
MERIKIEQDIYYLTPDDIKRLQIQPETATTEKTTEKLDTEIHMNKYGHVRQVFERVDIKHEEINSVSQEDQILPTKGLFSCYDCNYTANHKFHLSRHMNTHKKAKRKSGYRTYKNRINHCKHCKVVYKSKAVLDDHVLKKHPEFFASVTSKIHGCEICIYKTTIKAELDRHMLKHPDVKIKIDPDSFDNWKEYYITPDDIKRLQIQTKTSTPTDRTETFDTEINLSEYGVAKVFETVDVKHEEINSVSQENIFIQEDQILHSNGLFSCYHCNYTSNHKHHLTRHMNTHEKGKKRSSYKSNSPRKYKRRISHCKHCKAVYKSKAVLEDHVLKKHPEFIASVTSKIHGCEICTYKTKIKSEFDRHMLKHPDVKSNYKIKIEQDSFENWNEYYITPDDIKRLQIQTKTGTSADRTETLDKDVHLNEYRISKVFERVDIKHEKINSVSQEKIVKQEDQILQSKGLFSCYDCDYTANTKLHLSRHMNTHNKKKRGPSYKSKEPRPYKSSIIHCKHCKAVYKSKAILEDHVLKSIQSLLQLLQARYTDELGRAAHLASNRKVSNIEDEKRKPETDINTFESRRTMHTFESVNDAVNRVMNESVKVKKFEIYELNTEVPLEKIKSEVFLDDDKFGFNVAQLHESVDIKSEESENLKSTHDVIIDRIMTEFVKVETFDIYDLNTEVPLEKIKSEVFLDDDKFGFNGAQLHKNVDIIGEEGAHLKSTHDVVINSIPQEKILGHEVHILHSTAETGIRGCYRCNYTTDDKALLIDHMKVHTIEKNARMREESTNKNVTIHLNSITSTSSTYECTSDRLLPKVLAVPLVGTTNVEVAMRNLI